MFFGHFATNISYIIELRVSNIFKIIFLLKQHFFSQNALRLLWLTTDDNFIIALNFKMAALTVGKINRKMSSMCISRPDILYTHYRAVVKSNKMWKKSDHNSQMVL